MDRLGYLWIWSWDERCFEMPFMSSLWMWGSSLWAHGGFAHGARVGGGIDEPLLGVSVPGGGGLCVLVGSGARDVVDCGIRGLGARVFAVIGALLPAQGAAVPAPNVGVIAGALFAQGALVASWPFPRADAFSSTPVGPSRMGWLDVCAEVWGGGAVGSWDQGKREPKWKCWTTGNLERTSAEYIFIMPWRWVGFEGFGMGREEGGWYRNSEKERRGQ